MNLGINKILQTYSIDLQCVWEYLSSWLDIDILNESINDSIEKYVSDSESSDNEKKRRKPKLEFGNYLKHWTFTNNSVYYYVFCIFWTPPLPPGEGGVHFWKF